MYAGDTLLHEAAENGVVGEAVERLIPVAVLTVAGLYQFSPLREHCRRKRCGVPFTAGGSQVSAGPFGVREGLLCVGSCGSPMFVMFALGGGLNLIWMAAITAYTLAERTKGGKQLAPALGAILLLWAGLRLIL